MDKTIFYSLLALSMAAVYLIYHASLREPEPLWSKDFQVPYRKPIRLCLAQSETWLFVSALMLAVAIVSL